MTLDEKYADLAGRDFVPINEEHLRRYCHVVRVLPDHYRAVEGGKQVSIPGLVVNEFTVGYSKGKKVRDVQSAYNIPANQFLARHREIQLEI